MDSLPRLEGACWSFTVQPSPHRPIQTGRLALLPTEIIIMIGSNIDGPGKKARRDLKSLALSSSYIFDAIRPLFYQSDNFDMFRLAISTANIGLMERCHMFCNIPVNQTWKRVFSETYCRNGERHRQYMTLRPIDLLIEDLSMSGWKPDHIYALKWLHDKGFDLNNKPNSLVRPALPNLMPEKLVKLVQRGSCKQKINVVCSMIRFLSDRGFPVPLWVEFSRYEELPILDSQDQIIPRRVQNTYVVNLALRSHCPSVLLEVVLEEFSRRNLPLTSLSKDTRVAPPELSDWKLAQPLLDPQTHQDQLWFMEIDLGDVIGNLYADLMGLGDWKEEHPGEAADIWKNKLDLLIRHDALSEKEHAIFTSILKALGKIAGMPVPTKETRNADDKIRWTTLCESVGLFASDPDLRPQYADWVEPASPTSTRRPLRFVISDEWNPWKDWHSCQKAKKTWQDIFERYLAGPGSFSLSIGIHNVWDRLDDDSGLDQLPLWYESSCDQWMAAFDNFSSDDNNEARRQE
ncbi:hypothetical protein F66182_11132 [Fusarium sp. NRRL 66182]|nr:hypothetical protein F66182_11132 [Fusarium sp. NRRL 66182]